MDLHSHVYTNKEYEDERMIMKWVQRNNYKDYCWYSLFQNWNFNNSTQNTR